eukprot:6507945-Pyramimonas_sp.AAC.2
MKSTSHGGAGIFLGQGQLHARVLRAGRVAAGRFRASDQTGLGEFLPLVLCFAGYPIVAVVMHGRSRIGMAGRK